MLVLLVFPSFVFFGIQGYSRFNERRPADGREGRRPARSRRREWTPRMRERGRAGAPADARLDPSCSRRRRCSAWRSSALIRDRVLARRRRQAAPDDRPTSGCARLFKNDPQFASLRNPDGSVNRDALGRARHVVGGVRASACARTCRAARCCRASAASAIAPAAAAVGGARRDVPAARGAGRSASMPRTSRQGRRRRDAELEAYYKDPANAAQFQAPEQANIEYVVLDLEAVKKGITVSEDDLASTTPRTRSATPRRRSAAPATS